MNWLTSLKVAFLIKKVKSTVVGGSEAVVAVGNEMGSCRMDVGGVDVARA